MSAIPSNLLPLTHAALIRCTGWLGICWLITFIGWCVMLALWIRQLGRYNRAYRKYQQTNREKEQAYSEYKKTYGEPPENLRLLQQGIHDLQLRCRDLNENPGMVLKLLRRLGLILGDNGVNSGGLDRDNLLDVDGIKHIKFKPRMKWLKLIKHLLDFLIHKKRTVPNDRGQAQTPDHEKGMTL
jgi:hypothetical protein